MKCSARLFFYLNFICLLGCSSVPLRDTGVISSAGLAPGFVTASGIPNPLDDEFVEIGIAKKINWGTGAGEPLNISGEGYVFSDKTKELVWYARQTSLKVWVDLGKYLEVYWFKPDGAVYQRSNKVTVDYRGAFIHKIKFDAEQNPELCGNWRVKIWYKDRLVDDRVFKVFKSS